MASGQGVVTGLATFRSHTNGHVMHLRPSVLSVGGVENLGSALGD